MEKRGFTLVEVLIVIALIGILLAIAVPRYNDSMTKSKIEKQTQELHSLIMSARLSAMQKKQAGAVFLGPNKAVYNRYTSLDYSTLFATTPTGFKPGQTNWFPFVIKKKSSTGSGATLNTLDVTTDRITFDTRGFTEDIIMTLVVTPLAYNGGDNCIEVRASRTNIGRMENASTCRTR
jgi:prepilin-type N-terminal cleavage/methylation domain-containing protein